MLNYKGYIIAGVLALLWFLESMFPHFEHLVRHRRRRVVHDLRNISMGLINGAAMALLIAGVTKVTTDWTSGNRFGLLHWFDLPAPAAILIAVVAFDLWMYWWHWLNHNIAFFWRFHRMHHSDPALDATSALRFHPGEVLLSGVFRLGIVVLLGMSLWQLALYELVLFPIILLHHSNFELPAKLDAALRPFIVTPRVHWVHHSRVPQETNSNYGSIFTFWDRLFRSLRLREKPEEIVYGLDEFDSPQHQSFTGLLKTPFIPARERAVPPGE